MNRLSLCCAALFFACAPLAARTQQPETKSETSARKAGENGGEQAGKDEKTEKHDGARTADDVRETLSVTQHSILIGGETIRYTAKAGTLLLREEDGKKQASVFYVAYTRDGVADPATRPITFSFNGGPGSSSVWLHLGVLGPRRVDMGPEGLDATPPCKLVDNDASWLDLTDLVFIDPVTTGYSRAVPGESDAAFHGVEGDVQSVAEFIRLYTTRERRWTSPKFLAGESYGTTRAAALSSYLQQREGMFLNGIVLISAILNFQTAEFDTGNDQPYELFLPTYCATAFYHKKLAPDLQRDLASTLAQCQAFAESEYALALRKGSSLADGERDAIATKLARFTGLSKEYVERTNLRIEISRFCKELERSERKTVGRLDSRFEGVDRDAAGDTPESDPSMNAIQGPYTAAQNQYLRAELGYESDLVYEILTGRVHPWRFDGTENRYLDVAERLRTAMTANPALRVFVACGYYDLATPFAAAHYTFDHMGMERELRERITFGHYAAGHMMYIQGPSRVQLKQDAKAFYSAALGR
ncbi:MAG: peptidase S10 [Planctomycetes bacterium]|nr:peptidase S10 [Planctomycetota bacterium]